MLNQHIPEGQGELFETKNIKPKQENNNEQPSEKPDIKPTRKETTTPMTPTEEDGYDDPWEDIGYRR